MAVQAEGTTIHPTFASLVSGGAAHLKVAGVESPRLEAELLLAHVADRSRTQLLTSPDRSPSPEQAQAFARLLARRLTREPLPYILGHWEFYGLDLKVDGRALIPRPETEHLVERAVVRASSFPKPRIYDVGTGSGCIAVALARHLPQSCIYATDLSTEALTLAKENAIRLGARIHFCQGDLLQPLPEPAHLIVANLPYIARDEWATLMPEVGHYEPRLALDGGDDGLAVIRRLLTQAVSRLHPHGILLMEVGARQADAVRHLARASFPQARIGFIRDYAGHARVLEVCL